MMNRISGAAFTVAMLGLGLAAASFAAAEEAYAPVIDPAEFSTVIDNPYFKLPVGKVMHFESKTEDGFETTRIEITGEKKTVMGVEALVYWDRVYLDGKLKEETHDFIAQHKNGDVWYFGEMVDNYDKGQFKDHHGSWIAGEKGALPGIWVKASPQVGEVYREEYYKGEAEDMAKIVSISETVETKLGTFKNCVKTENTTPLEPTVKEAKIYCAELGGVAKEDNITDGESDYLVKVENGG